MEAILAFFSDLILFTAGLVVALFWVIIFMVIAVEVYDLIFNRDQDEEQL